jgi:hypothetical protein
MPRLCQQIGAHDHFFISNHEWHRKIIDIRQNERQILCLATGGEISCALASGPCIDRRLAPSLNEINRIAIFGNVSSVHQTLCDPGATHLVLFAKLTTAASPDDYHMTKAPPLEVIWERRVIAEVRDCRGGGAPTSDDGVAMPKKPFGRPLVATSLIPPSIPDWRATDTIATVPGRRQSGPA